MKSEIAKAPTLREIDRIIAEYGAAHSELLAMEAATKRRKEAVEALKLRVIALVEDHGRRHAEKSMRLVGLHNMATTTCGTMTVVDAAQVDKLRVYLEGQEMPELRQRFFSERVSYQLIDSPSEVLRGLTLPAKIRNRLTLLLAGCFQVKAKNPSLKIEIPELEEFSWDSVAIV